MILRYISDMSVLITNMQTLFLVTFDNSSGKHIKMFVYIFIATQCNFCFAFVLLCFDVRWNIEKIKVLHYLKKFTCTR